MSNMNRAAWAGVERLLLVPVPDVSSLFWKAEASRTREYRPKVTSQYAWMDTAILAGGGVEAAVIGPTGGGAHTAEEWVDLQSVEDTAAILALTAASYCQ
jgi:acetylornithine deacetylase